MRTVTSRKLNRIWSRRVDGLFPIDGRKLAKALVEKGFTQKNAPDDYNVSLFCDTVDDLADHLSKVAEYAEKEADEALAKRDAATKALNAAVRAVKDAPNRDSRDAAEADYETSKKDYQGADTVYRRGKAAAATKREEADLVQKGISKKPLRTKLKAGGVAPTQPDKTLITMEVLVRGPGRTRLEHRPSPDELCDMLESVLAEETTGSTTAGDVSADELETIDRLAGRASDAVGTLCSRVTQLVSRDAERRERTPASAVPAELAHHPVIGAARDAVSRARGADDVLRAGQELLSKVEAALDSYLDAERDRETAQDNSERALFASFRAKDDKETVAGWLARCSARSRFDAVYAEAAGSATDAAAARAIVDRMRGYAAVAAVADAVREKLDVLDRTLGDGGRAALQEVRKISERSVERDIAVRQNTRESFARAERAVIDAVERVGGLRCDSLDAGGAGGEPRQGFDDDDDDRRAATRSELIARVETMRSGLARLAGGEAHEARPTPSSVVRRRREPGGLEILRADQDREDPDRQQ